MKDHWNNSCFKAETATIAKNTISSVPNFEPACILPARQRSASALEPTDSCNAKIKKMHFIISKNAKYAKNFFIYIKCQFN